MQVFFARRFDDFKNDQSELIDIETLLRFSGESPSSIGNTLQCYDRILRNVF